MIIVAVCVTGIMGVTGTSVEKAFLNLTKINSDTGSGSMPVLLRLEDIGPGGAYLSEENLWKLRIVADYLHQEGVPFHMSVIPRVVAPEERYDVSITDDTLYGRDFVSTLKYMEKMGGIIGVHGYTHQTGVEPSGQGFEFYDRTLNPTAPDTLQYARERIASAIDLFLRAGIKPAYWETPHYTASWRQYPAFEEDMGLLFENNYRDIYGVQPHTTDFQGGEYRGYTTVPTPFGYITMERELTKMVDRLNAPDGGLASFFYHPFREFNYIKIGYNSKGEPYYVYDTNSPLHRLVSAYKEKGYTFVSIYSLVHFVPAQRLKNLLFSDGDDVFAGHFEPGPRKDILVLNKKDSVWHMYKYRQSWYAPRKGEAFEDRGMWLSYWFPESDAVQLIGDFNGDKLDDLLLFSPGSGTCRLAQNKEGRFVPGEVEKLDLQGSMQIYPLAGDSNGDGLTDLALLDREGGRLGLALNDGKGGFGRISWQNMDLIRGQSKVFLVGDFKGDHKDSIAVLDKGTGRWDVITSSPGGQFVSSGEAWLTGWGMGDSWLPFSAEVNGDGKSDLVLYNRTGHWQVATSDGNHFTYRGDFGPWGSTWRGEPLLADLDGDGRSDLVIVDKARDGKYNLDTALSVFDK